MNTLVAMPEAPPEYRRLQLEAAFQRYLIRVRDFGDLAERTAALDIVSRRGLVDWIEVFRKLCIGELAAKVEAARVAELEGAASSCRPSWEPEEPSGNDKS